MSGGAAAQDISGVCYIDMSRQGQSCVCETEAGSFQQAEMAFCRLGDKEQRLSALTPGPSTPPGVTPENPPPENPPPGEPPTHGKAKGNNGIGNAEVGDPPGIGNSGNDVEGTRTAQTTGSGAKGRNGSRPGSEALN
jgi:hypothetical protein